MIVPERTHKRMAPKSDVGHTDAAFDPSKIEFDNFAPAAIPPDGGIMACRYLRLERSTLGFTFDEKIGEVFPWIVVFEGVTGIYKNRDGSTSAIESGKEYALWLIHAVLLNSFKEAKPETGSRELFVVRGDGEKLKRGMTEGQKNSTYYSYSVAWPDRERVVRSESWDDV